MSRVCTVCAHAQRSAIDQELVSGGSFPGIAGRYGLAKSSVERHKADHLPEMLVRAAEQENTSHAIDVLKQLRAINGATLNILSEARREGDHNTALKAIDRVQRQIELQAKLLGELD